MTRDELIAKVAYAIDDKTFDSEYAKRAIAIAIDEAAKKVAPVNPRPCDCYVCNCGNINSAQDVAAWDEASANAKDIRAII